MIHSPLFLAILWPNVIWNFLGFILVIVSLLLTIVILMQDSKGGGLTSAFGAGPGGESLLGARMQRDIARWTAILATIFGVLVIIMGLLGTWKSRTSFGTVGAKSPVEQRESAPSGAAGPAESPAPAPGTAPA